MRRLMNLIRHPLTTLLVVLVVLPHLATAAGSNESIAGEAVVWTLAGLAFNLLFNYTGLGSFGQAAFFGVAAYSASIFYLRVSTGMMILPMVVGVLVGTLLGIIIAFLTLRRRGVYFSLLTLAFAQMLYYLAFRSTSLTGGENGLPNIYRKAVTIGGFSIDLVPAINYYYFIAAVVFLSALAIWRIVHSPFGRVIKAIQQNEQRAKSIGYNTHRYKLASFIISAFLTSVAGVLYAFLIQFMFADSLATSTSVQIMLSTVLGGFTSFFGPVIGAMAFVLLRDFASSYTSHWLLVFGAICMAVILFIPEGIMGLPRRLRRSKQAEPSTGVTSESALPVGGGSEEAGTVPPAARGPRPIGEEVLVCRGVTKHFGALTAVDGVDLSVRRGEIHSIIGPNGAGKTTFFNCITGALEPNAGQIMFEGKEITRLRPDEIVAYNIARSFQIISIFHQLTVWENVRIAAQAKDSHRFSFLTNPASLVQVNRKAREALEMVGLVGLDNVVAANLSHGDQRLLEIAIALATEPEMLMLDEPLAGLSPAERSRIADLIRTLAGEHTVTLIEHDIDRVLELSDRITVLHQGKVIAQGTPDQIQQNELVQQAYLGQAHAEQVRLASEGPRQVGGEVLLQLEGINSFYGKSHVLHDVSLDVREGEVVCLLGRNGTGKTTTLSSIIGTVQPRAGHIYFQGRDVVGLPPDTIARLGIALVPQGRRIFPNLTVLDNLRIAGRLKNDGQWNMDTVFRLMPKLEQLKDRRGETLSGGELQMLAIGRALMTNPRLLLLDEAMEGLAPAIVADVAHMIQQLRGKTTVLLVEQGAPLALQICDRAYVMVNGQITHSGPAGELARNLELRTRLLGV